MLVGTLAMGDEAAIISLIGPSSTLSQWEAFIRLPSPVFFF
jgi:hypothetical protein